MTLLVAAGDELIAFNQEFQEGISLAAFGAAIGVIGSLVGVFIVTTDPTAAVAGTVIAAVSGVTGIIIVYIGRRKAVKSFRRAAHAGEILRSAERFYYR